MVKRRYYFPYVERGTPFYHYTLTSKTLMERLGEIDASFERFADDSNSQSPKHILCLMLQQNESLLELSQYASVSKSEIPSPKVKSSPDSSIRRRGRPRGSSLKRKRLSLSDSRQSGSVDTGSSSPRKSPRKRRSATIYKSTELVPIPEESNPSISELKQKPLSVDESAKSGSFDTEPSSPHQMVLDSPPKQGSSTSSQTTDIVLASQESTSKDISSHSPTVRELSTEPSSPHQMVLDSPPKQGSYTSSQTTDIVLASQESTSKDISSHSPIVRELSSPVKEPQKNIDTTTCVQKDVNPIGEAEMSKRTDSTSPAEEFKVPALPDKDKKDVSAVSKPTELVPAIEAQSGESATTETSNLTVAVTELSSPIEKPEKDINPVACEKEDASQSDKTVTGTKTDSTILVEELKIPALPAKDIKEVSKPEKRPAESSPAEEFKTPALPVEDIQEVSKPEKRPAESSLSPTPEIVCPRKKAKTEDEIGEELKVPALPVTDKKSSSVPKIADLDPAIQIPSQAFTRTETSNLTTAVSELSSPIEKPEKDIDPTTCIQESPSDKAEMGMKTDSTSPAEEFKIPALPAKDIKEVCIPEKRPAESSPEEEFKTPALPVEDRQEVAKPEKRPAESSLSPTPEIVCPRKKAKTEDEMEVSSNKSPPAKRPTNLNLSPRPEFVSPSKIDETLLHSTEDDKMDISPNKSNETSDIPSKECKVTAVSQDEIESAIRTTPVKDDVIEIDMISTSDEKPGPSYVLTSAEIENLFDDPSRVKSIQEAVEERIKVGISQKETKEDVSPSEKKSSRRSPRKSRKIGSLGKDTKNTSRDDPEELSSIIMTHPNDMPVQGQVYFTREVRNLRTVLMRNARQLCNHLRPTANASKVDIPFWAQSAEEIHRLNHQNEHLLSTESSTEATIEFLREYETKLKAIWRRMDNRVLLADGSRLSLLEISADFKKLTKDFARYLIMIGLMKPNSLTSSERSQRQMRVSWR